MSKAKPKLTEKENRVYMLQSVISKNGSWNSDFTHNPKSYMDEISGQKQYFASDRSLKFAVRHLLQQKGKDVFIRPWVEKIKKSNNGGAAQFEIVGKATVNSIIQKELGGVISDVFWNFSDIRQFGMLYDGLGIHGVVQISQGVDKYGLGEEYEDDIVGPMVMKQEGTKTTTGMGSKTFLSEAHFLYDISVNPKNTQFIQGIKGYEHCYYSEEDYKDLLEGLKHGPANIKSTQKLNAYTGLLIQVEMNKDILLADLQNKIKIEQKDKGEKVVYDLRELLKYLEAKEKAAGEKIYKNIKVEYECYDIQLIGESGDLPITFSELV